MGMVTALVDMSGSRSFRMMVFFFFMFWIIFYDTVTAEVCICTTVNLQRLNSASSFLSGRRELHCHKPQFIIICQVDVVLFL